MGELYHDVGAINANLVRILSYACQIEKDRVGGVLCVADAVSGVPRVILLSGPVPVEKAWKYHKFAPEKGTRLAENPEHVSSFQSRNPEKEQYQGAILIRTVRLILSFSGFSEAMDEAIVLMLGVLMQFQTVGRANIIAKISQNAKWDALKEAMSDAW